LCHFYIYLFFKDFNIIWRGLWKYQLRGFPRKAQFLRTMFPTFQSYGKIPPSKYSMLKGKLLL